MRRFDALKAVRAEIGVSQHIPITHLNEPSIFESANGMLGMVLQLEGVIFDTEQDSTLNQYHLAWHRAITALDERFCIYATLHRQPENTRLTGKFNNRFAQEIDQRYHAQFQNRAFFVNKLYLTVIYKGLTTGKAGKGLSLFQKLSHKAIKSAREITRRSQIKALKTAVHQLQTTLSPFKPQLLGQNDAAHATSELLQFLSVLINGGEKSLLPLTAYANPIANSISKAEKIVSLYPHGNLAQYLAQKQILFGQYIQFQGNANDITFGAIVTIKRYGQASTSLMLDPLLQLDCQLISTNTFAIESKELALNRIRKHAIKMLNVDDPATSQLTALEEARDQIASDQITMGYHHNTVLLLAKSIAELETAITKTIKCYSDAGMIAVRETLGLEPAFWAQIPSNLRYIARSSLITSHNFADFFPLHNYRSGYRDGNHLGAAVTLLETPSKTPYFFNYHVKGSRDNPSKGHAFIIGGNNSGKTVLMTFLDAQMNRYGGNTFYFDRDRGAEIYIRATGGYYSILSPDYPENTRFNPFQLNDTPNNRQFCRELLAQLCKDENESELPADIQETLKNCVDYAYEQLAKAHRRLSHVVKILPLNFPRWPNLRRWLQADHKNNAGEYAYIFDNETDALTLQAQMGFDMTHFLDREPPAIRTAIMMYLFHKIDESLNGQRVSILLDEGWQYFMDPYWQGKLKRWLPTLRKRNGHIVMATQSPSSVIDSPIRAQLLDNIATQIFFANPQAKREEYISGFHLTESEYQTIAHHSPQSRLFLVKQEHDSTLCKLNLAALTECLPVLSGNTASVNLLDQIRAEVGDDPQHWLPVFYERIKELRT